MTISISSDLWDAYYTMADWFIDDNHIGKSCTLIYPPKRTLCSNCIINSISGSSTNKYRHGGPAPFNFGLCPMCGGNGFKEELVTSSIILRIYWNSKKWISIGGNVNIPNADAQIIGYLTDLNALMQATEILIVNEQTNLECKMSLLGEPALHGFGKNRYFIAFLKRV